MGFRGRLYGGIVAIALLWGGGQGLYTAVNNLQPANYTTADYLSNRPNDKWLTLSDAQLDLTQAAYSKTRGLDNINALYVPVFEAGDDGGSTIQVILETTDEANIQTVKAFETVLSEGEAATLAYVVENRSQLLQEGEVSGLVQYGIEVDDDTRRKLSDLYGSQLAEDFIFIEADAKPNILFSGGAFAAGLILGAWLLKPLVHKDSETSSTMET